MEFFEQKATKRLLTFAPLIVYHQREKYKSMNKLSRQRFLSSFIKQKATAHFAQKQRFNL